MSANGDSSHDAEAVADLLTRLAISEGQARIDAAVDVATHVTGGGIQSLATGGMLKALTASLEDPNSAGAREGGLLAVGQLADSFGRAFEPFMLPLLPQILTLLADKTASVRAAAMVVAKAAMRSLSPAAVPLVLPFLWDGIGTARKWQTKEGTYILLKILYKIAPQQITQALPELVPQVSVGMVDARDEVKKVAWAAMNGACLLVNNRDIEPCVPAILSSIARPAEVSDTIIKLSALVFVQSIEAPALAIMVPLLMRGLQKETAIKRRCAVIISNMSKLVNNPKDAHLFLPTLLPRLEQVGQEAADPELRSVAATAHATVLKIVGDDLQEEPAKKLEQPAILDKLRALVVEQSAGVKVDDLMDVSLTFISKLAALNVAQKNMELEEWDSKVVTPYLSVFLSPADSKAVCKALLDWCISETAVKDDFDDDDDEPGKDLCNCVFSLAYGGKILLNNARLRLKIGHRYGLCGANGAGKSTLMKAINRGQVDGFPPKSEVVTVYVEHDIDASLTEVSVTDFVHQDQQLKETTAPDREEVVDMLMSVGFSDAMQSNPVVSLSGGWKMKLALARAMLMKPHILLLDEPTNHLDSTNVAWLEHYLNNLVDVTCMVVSHDSGFLDNVCTDIIHYENRKLKRYRGNLSEFVKMKPEAKSYYSLEAASLRFNFPKPGFLDGINTNEKPILWMKKVSFTYPGAPKPQLTDVNIQCRLASRVAVLGVNGAGKSTLIKLLTGELKPDSGTVFKHPNLRVAYVAQHAFHHIEDFLDKTPNQYIRSRYSSGEDKEENSKVHRVLSKEEEQALAKQVWTIDGQPRVLDKIVGRRKKKRSYEYEVKWQGLSSLAFNRWIPREVLEEKGFEKIINQFDGAKAAAAVGQDARPLTQLSIEQYLSDFGLDPEFGTHSFIRGLSGGQKVKLVLAAAMWLNPQMMILDEPTNYLDRESLGALAAAIKEFGGGVVIISHHAEFTSALCQEVWTVSDGKVTVTGKSLLDRSELN